MHETMIAESLLKQISKDTGGGHTFRVYENSWNKLQGTAADSLSATV